MFIIKRLNSQIINQNEVYLSQHHLIFIYMHRLKIFNPSLRLYYIETTMEKVRLLYILLHLLYHNIYWMKQMNSQSDSIRVCYIDMTCLMFHKWYWRFCSLKVINSTTNHHAFNFYSRYFFILFFYFFAIC